MTQHQPLASVAPGLYRLLRILSGYDDKEDLRALLHAPYHIQSRHILLCAFGDLRAFLKTMHLNEVLTDDLYDELCGEAANLYANAMEI